MKDLQEVDVIECLCFVLARHRQAQRVASADAMQVDSASSTETDVPSLADFLSLLLRSNFSPTSLRVAFRRYLSDVDDVVCLLEVLDSWMGQWAGRDLRFLPTNKMMKKNEHGVLVVKLDNKDPYADIPSMLQVSSILQVLQARGLID